LEDPRGRSHRQFRKANWVEQSGPHSKSAQVPRLKTRGSVSCASLRINRAQGAGTPHFRGLSPPRCRTPTHPLGTDHKKSRSGSTTDGISYEETPHLQVRAARPYTRGFQSINPMQEMEHKA
jgi:hypothetical protein